LFDFLGLAVKKFDTPAQKWVDEAYVLRKTITRDTIQAGIATSESLMQGKIIRAPQAENVLRFVPQTERPGCQTKKQIETPTSNARDHDEGKTYARPRRVEICYPH